MNNIGTKSHDSGSQPTRILMIEDNEFVIESVISFLHDSSEFSFEIDTITTVENGNIFLENNSLSSYDVILLDYYAPDGSFHELDLFNESVSRIVSISSVERCNQLAKKVGVKYSVLKDLNDLKKFNNLLLIKITKILAQNT